MAGRKLGHGTADVERTIMVGSASTVQSPTVRSRSVTAPAGFGGCPQRGDGTGRAVAMAERVPWPAAPIAMQRTG